MVLKGEGWGDLALERNGKKLKVVGNRGYPRNKRKDGFGKEGLMVFFLLLHLCVQSMFCI